MDWIPLALLIVFGALLLYLDFEPLARRWWAAWREWRRARRR